MTIAVVIFGLIGLFLLAGALPSQGDQQAAVLRSPVFITLAALLCAWTLVCIASPRWRHRRLLAVASHIGPLVLLGGALTGFLWARQGTLVLPLTERHHTDHAETDDGQALPLGFQVSATRFAVDYYPPQEDDLGDHSLTNGSTLQQAPRAARSFDAQLAFTDTQGNRVLHDLRVNHPVTYGGWRFHLQSYDSRAQRYIVVNARQDPGRLAVLTGIWIVLAGTALACWKRG